MPRLEKIRIAFLEGNIDGTIGGSYYSLLFLVESLDRSRFEPLVIFRDKNALWPEFEQVAEVWEITPKPPIGGSFNILRRGITFTRFLMMAVEQARFLRRNSVQMLHLNNSVSRNHDWMIAALLAGIPCITHERGINYQVSWFAKVLASTLRAVLCISEAVRNAVTQSGVSGVSLYVVHNGLDPVKIKPRCTAEEFRVTHGISKGRRVIGMVGNVRQWKGQEVVVRALAEIVRRHPDVLCLFVGDISPVDIQYDRHLRRLIDDLGLRDHVLFTGYCLNVADALNVMEIAIHASILPEPFGRVLLEAMAMRKPVIASRDGAVPEIVVDGVTGFTFKPGDHAELADRVGCLLESRDLITAFGEAGYNRLMRDFHVKKNVERTVEIYGKILRHGVPDACRK